MFDHRALKDYFNIAEKAFRIPDIDNGFIPQGIDHDEGSDCFFLTGYMDRAENSPIYVIGKTGGELKKKILMTTADGETFRGHAGGLSVFGNRLYIAGSTDACMYSYSVTDILNAGNNEKLAIQKTTTLKTDDDFIRVSFTSRDGSFLYAGEFHSEPIFYTHKSHLAGQEGIKHKAYLFGFSVKDDSGAEPACVFSIPDNVQGAFFSGGYLYLSRSHGLLPGQILSFDLRKTEQSGTRSVLGKEVPFYFINEKSAGKVTTVPPMPEEITVVGDRMYILHEAASNRYLIGKLLDLDHVYSTPIDHYR